MDFQVVMSRGDLEFTVGPGGEFTPEEIAKLKHQAHVRGQTKPLSKDHVAAILAVKRILGGKII